jgi:hypothetical protein
MKKKLFMFILFLAVVTMQATTLRVSSTGDNSDGSTWAKAFTSIKAATAAAVNGDEIWVQQGTYVIPDEASQLNFKSGVNVYGGFLGTETTLAARSTNPALTIITHASSPATNFILLLCNDLNDLTTWDGFTFDGNNVGRGVQLSGNSTLNNSVIKNCKALNSAGAAVYMASTSGFIPVTLSNCEVINNTLESSGVGGTAPTIGGAGVFVYSGSTLAAITNCKIANNILKGTITNAVGYGAGIMLFEGTVTNCIIDSNTVTNTVNTGNNNTLTGAGIAIMPVSAKVNKVVIDLCTITNNVSNSRGGAILIDPRFTGQYKGDYTISRSNIRNNKSDSVGGAILSTAPTAQTSGNGWTLNVINSVIANNTATSGAAMFINIGGAVNITYSTIVNNYASTINSTGGIHFQSPNNHINIAKLKNTLLWGNTYLGPTIVPERMQIKNSGQATTMTYCAVQDLANITKVALEWPVATTTLGSNVDLNSANTNAAGPNFSLPSSGTGYSISDARTAKWQILASSPCVDSGDYAKDTNNNPILVDFAGTGRPADGSFDFTDIGAYEYISSLGINYFSKNIDFNIYPAISNSTLTVDSSAHIKQIEIFTINGSSVLKTNENKTIDVSKLSNGLYLVIATFDDNNKNVKRFIKN